MVVHASTSGQKLTPTIFELSSTSGHNTTDKPMLSRQEVVYVVGGQSGGVLLTPKFGKLGKQGIKR